jgi:small subunit ribosomal protein S4
MVNGRRTTTPSHQLRTGDVLTIREGSRTSPLFAGLADAEEKRSIPQWMKVDVSLLKAEVTGEPAYTTVETGLDYATVFEFYSR